MLNSRGTGSMTKGKRVIWLGDEPHIKGADRRNLVG